MIRRLRRLLSAARADAGQAATEYSLITAAVLLGVMVGGAPLWISLLRALQAYFDSFYLVLRLPIP